MENARLGKLIRIAEGRRNGRKKNEFHDLFYFTFFFNICDSFVVKTCLNFFFPFFLFFFEESFTIIPSGLFSNIVSSISISEEMQ